MKKANYILKRKMTNCIRAHCRILEYVFNRSELDLIAIDGILMELCSLLEKVATTQSPVIFAQFGGAVLILSTMAFQTTIVGN